MRTKRSKQSRFRSTVLSVALPVLVWGSLSGNPSKLASSVAICAIHFYQTSIHPVSSRFFRCRLQPTCSAFALDAFRRRSFVDAIGAVAQRLVVCSTTRSPLHPGVGQTTSTLLVGTVLQARNPDAACSACCASMGFVTFLIIGAFVLSIVLLVWVAKDAKSRGVDSPILWMVLVFCTNVIGLVIYLSTRPPGDLVKCEKCPNNKLQYAKACPHCGHPDSRVQA
jgi:putative component of membrane protein insertase Oxa1/YidC/SpoIIIJ protein YidD